MKLRALHTPSIFRHFATGTLILLAAACGNNKPPAPPPTEPMEAEAPLNSGKVKRFGADIGLLNPNDIESISAALEKFRATFKEDSKATCDHAFAYVYHLLEKTARAADSKDSRAYPNILSELQAGKNANMNLDDYTRTLFRNGLIYTLGARGDLDIEPDWSYMMGKYGNFISDTMKTILEQRQLESRRFAEERLSSPTLISPEENADIVLFWAALKYDISDEFPLKDVIQERYRFWFNRLLPKSPANNQLGDYQVAWGNVAKEFADTTEGHALQPLVDYLADKQVWDDSCKKYRNFALRELNIER